MIMRTRILGLTGITLAAAGFAAAFAATPAPAPVAAPSAMTTKPPANFMAMSGYLPKGAAPDSLLLNPAPPAAGSAAEARDVEAANAAVKLRGTPRWEQAKIDADLFKPTVTSIYSCAAGLPIGPTETPKLDALLKRAARDLAGATYPTKTKYQRARPFMVNNQPDCTPEMDAMLRKDGSYPSGHSAIGYGWGLILAEAIPDRTAQLVARGRAFGDSRRICNVHWLSDIEEGRVVATAVVARMNAEPAFQADLAAARAEVAALAGKSQPQGCAAEAAALAQ
jgi:acid phosphatase (class A)